MKDQVFEECEYTNTLNHMIGRYHNGILTNHTVMEVKMKEFHYLMSEIDRNEYYKNLYTIDPTEEVVMPKRDLSEQERLLLELRTYQRTFDNYKKAASEKLSDEQNALKNERHQNEINRKRENKFKTEKEREFKKMEDLKERYLKMIKLTSGSIIKDIVTIHHAQLNQDGVNSSPIKPIDVEQE